MPQHLVEIDLPVTRCSGSASAAEYNQDTKDELLVTDHNEIWNVMSP